MSEETSPKNQSAKQRRDFLKKVSTLGAVLGVTGTSSLVFAEAKVAADPKPAAIQSMVSHALDTLDIEAAIKKHNAVAKLNDKQLATLRAFTKEDLGALKGLRTKYATLKTQVPELPQGVADTAW